MTPISIKAGFPEVLGNLSFQNRWLRLGMMFCLIITALSLCTSAALIRRKPTIIALDQCGNVKLLINLPPIEVQAEQAARKYVSFRYIWSPETQASNLAQAKGFVAPQSLKAFEKTITDLQTFSKGKGVSQRVYPTSVSVDAKSNRIQVTGDRFTEIQGLKAATTLHVTLTYQSGTKTLDNPWGIYFVKEEEVQ